MSESITLADADATRRCGNRLGEALRACDAHVLIGLSGELGAGKTSLVGGVLEASGVRAPVRSPTYTLIEPYELQGPQRQLYHLDLYRLRHALELEDLGVRDLLAGNSVLLVEWIENAPELAAQCDLRVRLAYADRGRTLTAEGHTAAGRQLAGLLLQQ